MNPDTYSEGILPAKQLRSQRRRRAILDAAHRLLEEVGYERMKMEDIAAEAESSVGTLYQRFRDKEGLLDALMGEILQRLDERFEREMTAEALKRPDMRQTIRAVVALIVDFFNANQGFVRAVVARQLGHPDGFSPLRPVAQKTVARAWAAFGELYPDRADETMKLRFRFAFQMVLATSSNAVLNRPGPLLIGDPALPDLLTEVAVGVLENPELPIGDAAIAPPPDGDPIL